MNDRCNGCGRVEAGMATFECTWPDGRVSIERHCSACRFTWQRQLKSLGARVSAPVTNGNGDTAPPLGAWTVERKA